VVLGWGEDWGGWKWRCKTYIDFLSVRNQDDIFVLMDSFDTLAAKPPAQLFKAFKSFDKTLVFGAEWYCGNKKNCGDISLWWKRKNVNAPRNKYLNAGFVMGSARHLLTAYINAYNSAEKDDQKALSLWISEHGEGVALDSGSALVKNVNFLDGFMSQKNSCFYHFPGPLLKIGLMPMYDSLCEKLLWQFARKQNPSEIVQSTKIFVQIVLVLVAINLLVGFCMKKIKTRK
jgi:hypothetical protein